ncbi:hypothetical protein ACVXG7_25575 [Enterobacter hormaechei]
MAQLACVFVGLRQTHCWDGARHDPSQMIALPRDWQISILLLTRSATHKIRPVLDVLEAGQCRDIMLAAGGRVDTEIPRYRVWRDGELAKEVTDVLGNLAKPPGPGRHFLIGCSFTFKHH